MRAVLVGLVLLALASAGTTVYLAMTPQGPEVRPVVAQKKAEQVYVLVATKPLPAGRKMSGGDVKWVAWPKGGVQTDYVSATQDSDAAKKPIVGRTVRRAISEGVPVLKSMTFDRASGGILAGTLSPGMRAVTITVKPSTGGSGFIRPGDFVDIILTHDLRKLAPKRKNNPVVADSVIRHTAETVLENIRVIAADLNTDEFDDKIKTVKTVTLETTARQAEGLAVAQQMGKLSLALRSLASPAVEQVAKGFTTDLDISRPLRVYFAQQAREAGLPTPPLNVMKGAGTQLAKKAALKLSKTLKPGSRAVAISVSAASGAAGFIQPGDVVDVILTHDVSKIQKRVDDDGAVDASQVIRYTAETILQYITVLAIDQEAGDIAEEARIAKTVTLQVSAVQAQKLSVARMMGQISLALRAVDDQDSDGRPKSYTTDLDTSPTLAFQMRSMHKEPGPAPAVENKPKPRRASQRRRVRVFRAGSASRY